MKRTQARIWLGCWLPVLCPGLVLAQVQFSEIMYHPVEQPAFLTNGAPVLDLYEDVHEFVELYNRGSNAVSLAGWSIAGGIGFNFPDYELRPGGYLVIAKDPDRLAAVTNYALARSDLLGPWLGQLGNKQDVLRLLNATGQVMEEVAYSASFPWPICANALGADEEWLGFSPAKYQYRGRSLERVSFVHSTHDPANWLAAPLDRGPSPGQPNAVQRETPLPVVLQLLVSQAVDGQRIIRSNQPVRVDAFFSATRPLSDPRLEYFVDNIDQTNEVRTLLPMAILGHPGEGRFRAELPGQKDRSVVRFRLWANRGGGDEVVSPRTDDPFSWHAYFVTPTRTSTNAIYDVFVSTRSLTTLSTNISQNPRRYSTPDPPGKPRACWNATEPAVFVYDGIVYDARIRYHGSQFRRDVGRQSYKIQFPSYQLFNGRASMFVTDKDYQTVAGHAIFRAAEIPTSLTQWVDFYLNSKARLVRLEQEECDDFMLERYHREQERLHPGLPPEEPGEPYKAEGIFEAYGGPYGRGDGSQLPARGTNWTALQRYEWTYAIQAHAWRGHSNFKQMLDKMWVARGNKTAITTNEAPKLRTFFGDCWDIDKTLTYLAVINWMCVWDDTVHNHFLWQRRNGLWGMMPWDFDNQMNGQSASTSIYDAAPFAGPNFFKQSFITAYRKEFAERAWWLNNTTLHPDNLAPLGVNSTIQTWARSRLASVNNQTKLGSFNRPVRPVNQTPKSFQAVAPGAELLASAYAYSTNLVAPHATTTWMIRSASGTYYDPAWQITTSYQLTNIPIPFQDLTWGKPYYWRCFYTDTNGHPSVISAETSFRFDRPPITTNQILINEIMAAPGAAEAGQEYVELLNPGAEPLSLDGMSLTDDLLKPEKFLFPTGVIIASQACLVVWCGKDYSGQGLRAGFSLKPGGETVGLYRTTNGTPLLIDAVQYGLQIPGFAVGRNPEIRENWTLTTPTPGTGNHTVAPSHTLQVKFNEWMMDTADGAGWLELFNPANGPVEISGLGVTDNPREPYKWMAPPLSFIPARGFLVLFADEHASHGGNHLNFKLNPAGSTLGLYGTNGMALDLIMTGPQTVETAQGRLPDGGTAVFTFKSLPTPGFSNEQDLDHNGLPDAWERAYGLPANDGEAASADSDLDGLTNEQELMAGTDPLDAQSRLSLAIQPPSTPGGNFLLQLTAMAGRSYVVEYCEVFENGYKFWHALATIPASETTRMVSVNDAPGQWVRFYRIRLVAGPTVGHN